jgi:hypothetical protein
MKRKSNSPYAIEVSLTPLEQVARLTKKMEPEFIDGNNNIADAFVTYARPLVGKMPVVGSFDELKTV